ncbi:MAG: universal stress protein, partial [Bacteroidota bacterium]
MKRILVPSDLSDISENALQLASAIAAKTKAEIYLVHFMDHPFGDSFRTMGSKPDDNVDDLFTVQLLNKNHARLGQLAEKYGSDDVEINFQVYDEDFDDGIVEYIKKENVDLVVMGTTGEETLEERFTGNNTEQAIQTTPDKKLSVLPVR